ncbi:zinc finger protein 800 isoform X2 [Cardiocondyla obscurior]|uniref:zinc finger protein 800 isoform X2 n=1 Tax=Cardiocondyla obscurior TaxID=286306 RepID=UPI00396564DC
MKPTLQTKGKSKRNERFGKILIGNTNSTNRPDLSSLRKPIDTSISNLYQVCELLDDGTDEVKSILSHECNVIYECRVCHSLFRSIGNLVSHKREYCTEKFDVTLHRCVLNNYNTYATRESVHMHKAEKTSNDEIKNDRILRSQVCKRTNKKDLTTIIDVINKRREEYMENITRLCNTEKCVTQTTNGGIKNDTIFENQVRKKTNRKNSLAITRILNKTQEENIEKKLENEISNVPNNQRMCLQAVDTNCSAVCQTVESSDAVVDAIDLVKDQIIELQDVMNPSPLAVKEKTPTIQLKDEFKNKLENQLEDQLKNKLENQPEKSESPIQANMNNEENELLIHQLPIDNCQLTCSKSHKKNNKQVRKLKLKIQQKAFHRRTNEICTPRTSTLKNIIKNSNKTQKSINRIESRKKLCGRRRQKLNRKASLSYLQYQMPIASCDETTIRIKRCNTLSFSTPNDIQCKTKNTDLVANTITESSTDKDVSSKNAKQASMSSKSNHKKLIIQDVFSLNEKQWNEQNHEHNISKSNSVDNNNESNIISSESINDSKLLSHDKNEDNSVSHKKVKSFDDGCIDTTKVNFVTSTIRNKEDKTSSRLNEKELIEIIDLEDPEKVKAKMNNYESESSYSTPPSEKNPTLLMETIATIADFAKVRCLLCKRRFTSLPNLRRHLAMHVGWNRYRCKLCDFKCYLKCGCVAHCKTVHNIHNSEDVAETIFEIPESEYTCEKNVADVTDPKTKSNSPDIIEDATASLATPVDLNDSNDLNTYAVLQSKPASTANEQTTEPHENSKDLSVNNKNYKKMNIQDLSEFLKLYGEAGSFHVKEMLMEVILGSTDTSEVETHSDNCEIETRGASEHVDTSNNANNAATSDESKETFCPVLNNVKHQRPSRNRIKLLSKDFIYDLKEINSLRETSFINDSESLHVQKKAKHLK